ncbi:hypothetical protein [Oceanirhabdus seepicola]|uniref:Uncharacterized protein n=1 Tax=Oceanirhabdus seepicola TaxID=2828781 RepID=A0A9J6NWD6_9CLOT|nr:hypothetical protein [Oceanirhabdus seepicola]MCM1988818.1 hypothetical protein [Oceanirhabdus seepicola]
MRFIEYAESLNLLVTEPPMLEKPKVISELEKYNRYHEEYSNIEVLSHHSLVNSKDGSIDDELYVINSQYAFIFEGTDEINFEYKIIDDILTINVLFIGSGYCVFTMPFVYSLTERRSVYELSILLQQDIVNILFLYQSEYYLGIEYKSELVLPEEFKNYIIEAIDELYDYNCDDEYNIATKIEKEVVNIEELLEKNKCNDNEFEYNKYNWVDVKEIAEKIFYNYSFEINWAEDAWNIFMHQGVVISDKITKTDHDNYEYGDILLWLIAMYDLCFEFKYVIDHAYYDESELIDQIYSIDEGEKYIGTYLMDEIYEELNERLIEGNTPECEFYDKKSQSFNLGSDSYSGDTSIAYDVCVREVEYRRKIFKNQIINYFNNDAREIYKFMIGEHWVKYYFNMEEKRENIENKYDKIIKVISEGKIAKYSIGTERFFEVSDEHEAEEDRERELEELEEKYNANIAYVETCAGINWVVDEMSYKK